MASASGPDAGVGTDAGAVAVAAEVAVTDDDKFQRIRLWETITRNIDHTRREKVEAQSEELRNAALDTLALGHNEEITLMLRAFVVLRQAFGATCLDDWIFPEVVVRVRTWHEDGGVVNYAWKAMIMTKVARLLDDAVVGHYPIEGLAKPGRFDIGWIYENTEFIEWLREDTGAFARVYSQELMDYIGVSPARSIKAAVVASSE